MFSGSTGPDEMLIPLARPKLESLYIIVDKQMAEVQQHLKPLLDVLGSDTASLRHCTVEPS